MVEDCFSMLQVAGCLLLLLLCLMRELVMTAGSTHPKPAHISATRESTSVIFKETGQKIFS